MRTFLTVLAALAAATTVTGQVAFDKASCTRTNFPTEAYTFEPSADGAWSCVNFDVAQNSATAMKIQVPLAMDGAQMQVIMWNAAQTGGATGTSSVWNEASTTAAWDSLFHLNPQGAGGDLANFDPAVPDPADNSTSGVSMRTVWGSTSGAQQEGVYAYVTNGNIQLNLDTNYLQITHPDDGRTPARTGQDDYEGVFMWRFVDPRQSTVANTAPLQRSGSWLTTDQVASTFGELSAGNSIDVNNLLLPGASIRVKPDSDTIINNVLPLRKFGYKVAISGTGVGNMTQVGTTRFLQTDTLPFGYGDNTDLVSFTATGTNTVDLAGSQSAWYNITDPAIMDNRVRNVSWADSTTTLQVFYNKPLDADSDLTDPDFGNLVVTLPDFRSQANVGLVDWTGQASPFLNVAITLTDFETFPMLSSLSNLRLRNHGINEDEGHSLASPVNQVPFAIYLVNTDASAYTARVAFSNVVNLNNEDGVAPAAADASVAVSPGCNPLWEVQAANGFGLTSSSSSGTQSNRRVSGWSQPWGYTGAVSGTNFDWYSMKSARGLQVSSNTIPALKNDRYESYGSTLVNPPTRRSVWLLVRISAARPRVPSSSALQCGSNWVQIGSASWQTTSPFDQCRSNNDCTVNSADNPNEDQASESANGAANRFSTCLLLQSVSNGQIVPTSKCVECYADTHCDGGQYCHVDNGICEGVNGYQYVCDQPSHDRTGLCREKSTDVLGARCTPNFDMDPTDTSSNAISVVSPISFHSDTLPGASDYAWRTDTTRYSIDTPVALTVLEGDADNSDFAPGARGACGEFRFWNGSALPDSLTFLQRRNLNGASVDGLFSHTGQVRTTLWSGLCVNMGGNLGHRCVECMPGSGANGASGGASAAGKICLNGRAHSARDVDGTVRSYTTDTGASTELGTTMMVVLLILLFWTHMYAEAKRWRIANGKKAMTCCECICCCGVCSNEGGAAPASGDEGKSASQTAPAPAPEGDAEA